MEKIVRVLLNSTIAEIGDRITEEIHFLEDSGYLVTNVAYRGRIGTALGVLCEYVITYKGRTDLYGSD